MAAALDDLRPAPLPRPEAPAGLGARLAAALLDLLVLVAFLFAEAFVLAGPLGLKPDPKDLGGVDLAYFALALAFAWLYAAGLESGARGATLGKRALGLAVRTQDGNRAGFARTSLRFLVRSLSFLVGWIVIPLTSRRQALHDLAAGTVVVRADRHP